MDYKKERRDTYKTTGLKALIKKFSAMDDDTFDEMVENSMVNNWSGLFDPTKNRGRGGKGKGGKGSAGISDAMKYAMKKMSGESN
jgi:hypothetical protein